MILVMTEQHDKSIENQPQAQPHEYDERLGRNGTPSQVERKLTHVNGNQHDPQAIDDDRSRNGQQPRE
jgi:hypothetical protein